MYQYPPGTPGNSRKSQNTALKYKRTLMKNRIPLGKAVNDRADTQVAVWDKTLRRKGLMKES